MALTGKKIWLDGEMVNWDEAKVHVLSHALHYGTGYFEGIRCYALEDGRSAVFRLDEHVRRFFDSGKILGFPLPRPFGEIKNAILDVVRANGLKECYIRPLAFVGLGEIRFTSRSRRGPGAPTWATKGSRTAFAPRSPRTRAITRT
jgi:branched-chain amino acid aminotransferase